MLQNKLHVFVAGSFSSAGQNSFAFTVLFRLQNVLINWILFNTTGGGGGGGLYLIGLIIGGKFFCLQVDEPIT